MRLRVKKGRTYFHKGRDHKEGEEVEVEDKFATALCLPAGELEEIKPRGRGQYNRRDMRPEP
jgi:hypothetical protein